mmetsp:Transcript_28462/g.69407  ORF Transcript_28462/g.69407 Transcript_28462/m.69407 type:complete len:548 (+) Transcript_28462:256-1899(+)
MIGDQKHSMSSSPSRPKSELDRMVASIGKDPCIRWLILIFVSLMPIAGHSDFEERAKVDVSSPSFQWTSAMITYILSMILPIACGTVIDLQGTALGGLVFALLAAITQAFMALALETSSQGGILTAHSILRGLSGGLLVANSSTLSEYFTRSELGFAIGILGSVNHLYKWGLDVLRDIKTHSIGEEEMKWGGIACGGIGVVAGLSYVLADAIYKQTQRRARASQGQALSVNSLVGRRNKRYAYDDDYADEEDEGLEEGADCCICSMPCAMLSVAFAQLLFSTSTQSLQALKEEEAIEKISLVGILLLVFNIIAGPVIGSIIDRVGYRMQISMIMGLFLALAQYFTAFTKVPRVVPFFMLSFVQTVSPTILRSSVPIVVDEREIGSAFGLFQAFQVTGDYGSQFAAISFKQFIVEIGLVLCGILGFFVSLIMAMCPFETMRKLGRPTLGFLSQIDLKELVREQLKPVHEGAEAATSCFGGCCKPCTDCCKWTGSRCAELCGEITHFFAYYCFYCGWFFRGMFCCKWRCEEDDGEERAQEYVPAYGSFD